MEEAKFSQVGTNLSVLLIFSSFLLLLILWGRIPNQVPLFYSLPWGEEQLTPPLGLFLLPAGSVLVLTLNLLMTKILKGTGLLFSLTTWSTTLFCFLAFYTLLRIIILVI